MTFTPVSPGADASRALLFDRLVDVAPGAPSGHIISRAELQLSVAREISAILNTRIDPAIDAIEPRERTVIEYGLPDFTALSAASGDDVSRLARAAERAIVAFEPRLARPRVEIVTEETRRDSVGFLITGILHVNGAPESFTFPVDRGPLSEQADAG
ncbi:MAG: tssE [Gemmatimonadetes bacterium]|nr:tssE [Gemmatimonadota bacterium]